MEHIHRRGKKSINVWNYYESVGEDVISGKSANGMLCDCTAKSEEDDVYKGLCHYQ